MKFLITGGAGFIGAHLVAAHAAVGDQIVVLDNFRRGTRQKLASFEASGAVQVIEGDIRNLETLRAAMKGCTHIYHLAAQSNVLGAVTDTDYSFTTNVIGTYNLLITARESGGVERIVFTSSREVYGEVDQLPVSEDRQLNPWNAYGASKVAGEVYCRTFQNTYGLDVSVLRLANVYGPGDHERVIPIWLERARQGLDLELYGGEQVLDLVPVDLVVQALRRSAETSLKGQAVNVGSGRGTTLRQLAARIQAAPGVTSGLSLRPPRAVEVTRFVADVSRMRSLLGLQPPADPLVGLEALMR